MEKHTNQLIGLKANIATCDASIATIPSVTISAILNIMLAQEFRFHGHGGLRYLYKHGKTARTRNFLLRYVPNTSRPHSRVTVIVSKKVSKSSARRNRIRRRVYEIIRTQWDQLLHPHDLSITAYAADIQFIPHEQLERELKQLLSSARLYKSDTNHDRIDKTS